VPGILPRAAILLVLSPNILLKKVTYSSQRHANILGWSSRYKVQGTPGCNPTAITIPTVTVSPKFAPSDALNPHWPQQAALQR